jgi:hypothetical protein
MFTNKEYNRFVNSFRVTAVRINEVASEDNREQTYCKYWLDGYLCKVFLDKQMPVKDDFVILPLFSGWCARFVSRAIARRDISFIYSLQKGSKLAWPSLGDIKRKGALEKHADRLSDYRGSVCEDVSKQITSDSKLIFHDAVRTANRNGSWKKFLPSNSACIQASRRDGGALSLAEPFILDFNCTEAKTIGKLPYLNRIVNEWRQTNYDMFTHVVGPALSQTDDQGNLLPLDVAVVALPEPGKFRIITKGDGYLYSLLQPFQDVLMDAWKHHYSSTMLIPDLLVRVKEMDAVSDELTHWCSVDYEAATDLLKKDASLSVLSGIPENKFSDLAYLSLVSGRAFYRGKRDTVQVDEGQLMGSPLSFPLLCTINLSVYHAAILRWVKDSNTQTRRRIAKIMWRNVLVNGDDMLFKCPKSFYNVFLSTSKEVGFKVSQGKNYISVDAGMINSKLFLRRNGVMKEFGYLNQRIILGNNIKQGTSLSTPTMIGKDINKMVSLCPWAKSAIPTCFERWGKDWLGTMYRPNWFLPVHLGGFGIDPKLASPNMKVTRSQRELAARFVDDPTMFLYRLKSLDIPTAKIAGGLANWRMVPGPYVPLEHESTDNIDGWLARLAYASQAKAGTSLVDKVPDKIFMKELGRSTSVKPRRLSLEDIEFYRNVQYFATNLPPCPPIGKIKVDFCRILNGGDASAYLYSRIDLKPKINRGVAGL